MCMTCGSIPPVDPVVPGTLVSEKVAVELRARHEILLYPFVHETDPAIRRRVEREMFALKNAMIDLRIVR